jgi:hypothetical protein
LQTRDALGREELAGLLRESYEMILAKLPKNMQESIAGGASAGHSVRMVAEKKKKSVKKMAARKHKKSRR